jgi:hypothetical protein
MNSDDENGTKPNPESVAPRGSRPRIGMGAGIGIGIGVAIGISTNNLSL